jgi:Phage P22-like portal protein
MDEDRKPTAQSGDEALLREIRERYTYASEAWEEVRKERQKDMRYICGNPWEDDDRKAREAAGRPVVNHDELNQYVNQAVNNLRQNKRGIKVEPGGNGADGKTAQVRQDLIRTIEYCNKAQDAYLRAGQDMLEGSYGYFRIGRKYVIDDPQDDPHAFDQEITLGAIPNPDSALYDPDTKQPDWSDAGYCFVVEPLSIEEFRRQWPNAQKRDFTAEDMRVAKGWVSDKTVLVAEYWKVIVTERELVRGKERRKVEQKTVCQYMTNGLEIWTPSSTLSVRSRSFR